MTSQHLSLDDFMRSTLSDPERALGYLEVALEEYMDDGDHASFLKSVRRVIDAQGGPEKLAQDGRVDAARLQELLAGEAPPELLAVDAVFRALGARLAALPIAEDSKVAEGA